MTQVVSLLTAEDLLKLPSDFRCELIDGVLIELSWEMPPDLVVEVVSPGDTQTEVQAKVREWIEAEVPLVWVARPRTRTVEAISSLLERKVDGPEDMLDGGDVLPGFSCRVADLFG